MQGEAWEKSGRSREKTEADIAVKQCHARGGLGVLAVTGRSEEGMEQSLPYSIQGHQPCHHLGLGLWLPDP